MKKIRYIIEALIVRLGMAFFGILGAKNASNFTAKLALIIGKKHSTHKLAFENMSRAMPNLNNSKKEKILDEMWMNLGRIVGEYVYIAKENPKILCEKYLKFDAQTLENIEFIKSQNKGGIIFSAHLGNWEIGPKALISKGLKVNTVYRPLNNPYVEAMTAKMRGTKLIAKSTKGNREIIEAIKNNEFIIILADQKISEGEPIKFFHDDAITTTSLARIALKYNVPLIPARSIRLNNEFKFEVKVEKPLEFYASNDLNKDVLSLTRAINQKLEQWILEYPAQWFWVHNRWKK